MKLIKIILTIALFCSLSCAKKEKPKPSAALDYSKAMKKLKNKDYFSASEAFEKINDDYPLSKWATKGQIMAAYSHYRNHSCEETVAIADNFNQSNPSNDNVPYLKYLKGICFYNQMNPISRAQDNATEASITFRELIARFPKTEYAADGKEKLKLIDEHIAGATMSSGRYKARVENYVGAIKDFQNITYRYARTNQISEAYFRLYEIHQKIGLEKEAQTYLYVLKKEYPQSLWINQI
jgi:outer membrane protein assembly factor BamD